MGRKTVAEGDILIDLALQGGGAHGAFTWGVLDRLLEEPNLHIEGISGTSAGSMNAALLAYGDCLEGREGAKRVLHDFWFRVSQAALFGPFQRGMMDILAGRWSLDHSPAFVTYDFLSRIYSPYDLNPLMLNPLLSILQDAIDFDALSQSRIKLFVNATCVRTGQGRVFHNAELSAQVLLASACLPFLYQAIEIDGEAYWDGGFTGNPTITPLVQECMSSDTILVQINPIERLETPKTARAIIDRINEIAFNAALMKELRMIALMRQIDTDKSAECHRWASMRIHRIASQEMTKLNASSKLNAEWAFLTYLREEGRRSAEDFLKHHREDLNQRSSFDLDVFL
ncbi:MAG: patatin-like phospholipase family protein [Legionellaceae bacterium]|nr:patatin-like phospholipase family protein [Legionellaceae bacterium]